MRYRIKHEILLYDAGKCPACGDHPLAFHVDGNFKCYRCETAKGYCTVELIFVLNSKI